MGVNMTNEDFLISLLKEVSDNAYNYFVDNYDEERFGPLSFREKCTTNIRKSLISIFGCKGLFFIENTYRDSSAIIDSLQKYFADMQALWNILSDEYSRKLLVQIFAYRILGKRRYKFALNSEDYRNKKNKIRSLREGNESIPITFLNWKLNLFKLKTVGYDLNLFYVPMGILATYLLKQYEYKNTTPHIKAVEGDYVIDAGGCWGDTALYFAHEVGISGKVFTFEFIPSNLIIMKNNLDLNSSIKNRIAIAENPLWSVPNKKLYYLDKGPASRVSNEKESDSFKEVSTASIDDFLEKNKIDKIDFIKMDIEGAELDALKGSENAIRKFRPKLAISVYHNLEHFYSIPNYLDSLQLGYKYYLDHHTIHNEETILYATI